MGIHRILCAPGCVRLEADIFVALVPRGTVTCLWDSRSSHSYSLWHHSDISDGSLWPGVCRVWRHVHCAVAPLGMGRRQFSPGPIRYHRGRYLSRGYGGYHVRTPHDRIKQRFLTQTDSRKGINTSRTRRIALGMCEL